MPASSTFTTDGHVAHPAQRQFILAQTGYCPIRSVMKLVIPQKANNLQLCNVATEVDKYRRFLHQFVHSAF
jgi:hypothetical protein